MQQVKQLELPEVLAPPAPVFYIEMDGPGVPVVKAETEGRSGKTEGQPAHTREAKLCRVFLHADTTDPEGRPLRDEHSTTYAAAIEMAEEFGLRPYTEAWRRGWSQAKKKVILGDGAVWIRNLAEQHFPGRASNRRSLPCPSAPLGAFGQAVRQRPERPRTLDGTGPRSSRSRQDRKLGQDSADVAPRQRRGSQDSGQRS